jgi:nicotinamidase-related amidase
MAERCTVKRSAAVLVLIDLQEKLAAVMPSRAGVVEAGALLAKVARELGIPIVATRQYPQGLGDVVPELLGLVPEGGPVDKVTFCCADEPTFCDRLADTGKRQVVIAGMETHICVTQTALALAAARHEVFVVADATCSRREEDHAVALDRMRAAGVIVTTAEAVIYEALGRAGTPEFARVLQLVKGRTTPG